jgi:hypothetical protein
MMMVNLTVPAVVMRHGKHLVGAFREHIDNEELAPFHEVWGARSTGELPVDVDTELVHAADVIIMRQWHIGAPFDGAFVPRFVDDVLLVLFTTGRTGDDRSDRWRWADRSDAGL